MVLMTICPYCEKVCASVKNDLDAKEHYAASFSDDFDAKMKYFSKSNGFHEILDN